MKKYFVMISMALAYSIGAMAAESSLSQKDSQAGPSIETREQMAQAHEKMALCLRSDVSVQDCHQQMRQQCQDMKGHGGCMMGNHMKNNSEQAPNSNVKH